MRKTETLSPHLPFDLPLKRVCFCFELAVSPLETSSKSFATSHQLCSFFFFPSQTSCPTFSFLPSVPFSRSLLSSFPSCGCSRKRLSLKVPLSPPSPASPITSHGRPKQPPILSSCPQSSLLERSLRKTTKKNNKNLQLLGVGSTVLSFFKIIIISPHGFTLYPNFSF